MINYKKETEALIENWKKEIDEKSGELSSLRREVERIANVYNPLIAQVNNKRGDLDNAIDKLYKFLKTFGDIGKPITPFDFVTERFMLPNLDLFDPTGKSLDEIDNQSTKDGQSAIGVLGAIGAVGAVGVGATGGILGASAFCPPAMPAVLLIEGIGALFSRRENREQYAEYQSQYYEDILIRKEQNAKAKNEVCFFQAACEIAKTYLDLIWSIKLSIDETILSELDGISAFLYADAIKNCIIEGLDPKNAEPCSIVEYKGTAYDSHFIFVQNAFDYYTLITKFFTDAILEKIFEDHAVTDDEIDDLKNRIADIETARKNLDNSLVFGGKQE